MTFNLKVAMNNDAFVQDDNELTRILRDLVNRLEACDWTPQAGQHGIVRDINGNIVGTFKIQENDQ